MHQDHGPRPEDFSHNAATFVEDEPIVHERKVQTFLREFEAGKGGRRAVRITLVKKTEAVHLHEVNVVGDLPPATVPNEAGGYLDGTVFDPLT